MGDLFVSTTHYVSVGFCLLVSIVLLTGRGSFLLAGYNLKPKSEKEKYDAPAMCRFMGKIMLPISLLVILTGIEALHDVLWLWIVAGAIIVGLLVFAIIYTNTGNRFKKQATHN